MKILIIQLARFGDIYQTLPVIKSLKRQYKDSEITLLVREKFQDATHELKGVVNLKTLETSHILSPIIFQAKGEEESLKRMDKFVSGQFEAYDKIINLSFSPFSSYLTDYLSNSHSNCTVRGYSRTHDGFLGLPDDVSAYFYAQVGTHRFNRIHLTELFAMVAGVELAPSDWQWNTIEASSASRSGIVIQVGASQSHKTLDASEWQAVIENLHNKSQTPIYLVGSKEDQGLPLYLQNLTRVQDLRGQNSLEQTFKLIGAAALLIAPDSVTVHMASVLSTPTLNISKGQVRFWETGPRALGSRVVCYNEKNKEAMSQLQDAIERMLVGAPADEKTYEVTQAEGVVYASTASESDFSWKLIQALYMQGDYPALESHTTELALKRIAELVDLGAEQLEQIKNPRAQSVALSILNEVDFLMNQVCRIDSSIQPLVNWFITQKIRITATAFEDVFAQTQVIYEDIRTILKVYEKSISWSLDATKDVTWKP